MSFEQIKTTKKQFTVYATGGAGIKIGSQLDQSLMDVVYIDSSPANAGSIPDGARKFFIEGMEGAGKLRKGTYEALAGKEDLLLETVPYIKDRPVVFITSLSGGTGSMTTDLLSVELIKRGVPVFILGVGTSGSDRELENTTQALQTTTNNAIDQNVNVSLYYLDGSNKALANEHVVEFTKLLTILMDYEKVAGIDATDLANFCNPINVSKTQPGLSIISLNKNEPGDSIEKGSVTASSILMSKDPNMQLKIHSITNTEAHVLHNWEHEELVIVNRVGAVPALIEELREELKTRKNNVRAMEVKESVRSEGSAFVFD